VSLKIAILCPVTSRGSSLLVGEQPLMKALIPSMAALDLFGAVRLVLGYDWDDPLWADAEARACVGARAEWMLLRRRDYFDLTAIWNELAAEIGDAEYFIPANDDLAFQTDPLVAIDTLKRRSGFGIVGFHDHAFPGLATFFMASRLHLEIFSSLYPLPWPGAHQDSWIADVYRPWGASEIDERIQCHNHIGAATRFDYGAAEGYAGEVTAGRKRINRWLVSHASHDPKLPPPGSNDFLEAASMVIQ
jgi:hypothetical protein